MNGPEELRMTPARRAILEALEATHCHPTADELHDSLRKSLPRVSLGTVYRNLEVMSRHRLIRTVEGAGGQRRYDAVLAPHHHIRCVRCGRVDDVEPADLSWLEGKLKEESGYDVLGHVLVFEGICPACSAAEGGKEEGGDNGAQGNEN